MSGEGNQFWNKSSLFHLSTFRALTQLQASPRWSPCSSKCIFAGQVALVLCCWIGFVRTLLLIPCQVLQQYSSTFLICFTQICVSLVSLSFHFLQSWLFDYSLLFCFQVFCLMSLAHFSCPLIFSHLPWNLSKFCSLSSGLCSDLDYNVLRMPRSHIITY